MSPVRLRVVPPDEGDVVGLGRIVKQIRREAGANPKKAGILGLMGLVALYFWAPLIMKWSDGGTSGPAAANPGAPATPSAPVAQPLPTPMASSPTITQPRAEKPKHTWPEWVAWMDADPRTRPAGPLGANCDPLRQAVSRQTSLTTELPKSLSPSAEASPESLKMVLGGTILSPNHRVARINGRTYAVGDAVEAAAKDGKLLSSSSPRSTPAAWFSSGWENGTS